MKKSFFTSWVAAFLCIGTISAQEPLQTFQMTRTMQVLKENPPAEPQTATVTLRKIYMGECGNDNNCHHEPVAGRVICQFMSYQNGEIPSLNGRSQIWQSNGHSEVCDNFYAPVPDNAETYHYEDNFSSTQEPFFLGKLQYLFDYQSLTTNQYYLRVSFNLGVNHQDNPFASVGGHWLAQGDNLLIADIALDQATINRRSTVIGPFQTRSDRCHEFWLAFSFAFEQ